jgi:NTE family protein
MGRVMANGQKKVALVIGSGSVKCAAAIGLHKALVREGIEVGMVVGCSGGGLYAAFIALGHSPEESRELSMRLWTRDVTAKHNSRAPWQIMLPRLFRFDENFGTVDDALVMERFRAAFGDRKLEETKIPLYLTATDFESGEQVVLNHGRLVDALRGSIAIPYLFKAHRVDGKLLVDGYLSDPMPVGVAIREGANVILAMGFESPFQERIDSMMRYTFQISSIMSNNLLKSNFAFHQLAHHSEVIPILPKFKQRIRLFDTDQIPYIIEEGERAANEQMPYLKKLLETGS